jgi:rRNA maturation protein Nop10
MTARCPVCGRPALTTAPTRKVQDVNLHGLYRHEAHGRTWLHEIVVDFGGMGFAGDSAEVSLDV